MISQYNKDATRPLNKFCPTFNQICVKIDIDYRRGVIQKSYKTIVSNKQTSYFICIGLFYI